MTLPIAQDLIRTRGDTKPFRWTVNDNTGAGQDLDGYTFKMTIASEKNPVDETTKIFSMTGSNDGVGALSFTPLVADVDLLGTYYYDVQMTDPDTLIYTLAKGKIKFNQDITK